MKKFSNLFAALYEDALGVYETQFFLIHKMLNDTNGYIILGLLFLVIPLFMWLLFYYGWRYPYGRLYHWIGWLAIGALLALLITIYTSDALIFQSGSQALNDALADPESGYYRYAEGLPLKYGLFNGLLSIIVGLIYSLLLKQKSKVQTHLPL